ncbi:MAG: peptide deformylase [Pseudomonadota bacterium]|nr:peptide deformylase [Pseudomonadota bacterium]
MAIREILEYPDPRLRNIASTVDRVGDAIRELIEDMLETMYASNGIGLAATQVNVHKRVIVIDISEEKNDPLCFINPELLQVNGSITSDEGCLSVPDIYEPVDRAENILVGALDRNGRTIESSAEGLLAVCIQHEIDHLNGKLFVDYLSQLKRQRLRKRIVKNRKRSSDSEFS